MANRKGTPDIMGNLMMTPNIIHDDELTKEIDHISNKAIKHEDIKTEKTHSISQIKQESNKGISIPKNIASKHDSNKEPSTEMKEKATFNLSLSTLEALEDAWIKLRRRFKGEHRITKTSIVEMALDICISDLHAKDSDSILSKRLADLGTNVNLNDSTT